MVGKNNHALRRESEANKVYRFSIRKLSFGAASVAIAAGLYWIGSATSTVHADEVNSQDSTGIEASIISDESPISESLSVELPPEILGDGVVNETEPVAEESGDESSADLVVESIEASIEEASEVDSSVETETESTESEIDEYVADEDGEVAEEAETAENDGEETPESDVAEEKEDLAKIKATAKEEIERILQNTQEDSTSEANQALLAKYKTQIDQANSTDEVTVAVEVFNAENVPTKTEAEVTSQTEATEEDREQAKAQITEALQEAADQARLPEIDSELLAGLSERIESATSKEELDAIVQDITRGSGDTILKPGVEADGRRYYQNLYTGKKYYLEPNWHEESVRGKGLQRWELNPGQGLRIINNISEPLVTAQLNYKGHHETPEGDYVLDLVYSWYPRSANAWRQVNLRISDDLTKHIDWTKSYYVGGDEKQYKFTAGSTANDKMMELSEMVIGAYANHTPIKLYLKDIESRETFDQMDTTIQSRILDGNGNVYTLYIGGDDRSNIEIGGYGAYTQATSIPKTTDTSMKEGFNPLLEVVGGIADKAPAVITSQNFVSYDSSEDTLYIISSHMKALTNGYNEEAMGRSLAYRLAFSKDLLDILKEDERGYIGYIEPSQTSGFKRAINPYSIVTGFTRDQVNVVGDVAYIIVAPQEFEANDETGQIIYPKGGTRGFLPTLGTRVAQQVYTVTRLNVDADSLKTLYPTIDGVAPEFTNVDVHSSMIEENEYGIDRLKVTTTAEGVARKGQEIKIVFDKKLNDGVKWKVGTGYNASWTAEKLAMKLGEAPIFGNLGIYPNSTGARGAYSKYDFTLSQDGRTYTYKMPYDIKVPKGTEIRLYTGEEGKLVGNSGKIYINDVLVAEFDEDDAETSFAPKILIGTEVNASALVDRTQYMPALLDMYDYDGKIVGYTYEPNQLIEIAYHDANTGEVRFGRTFSSIAATPLATYTINGVTYPEPDKGLYKFEYEIPETDRLTKDSPILARSYNYTVGTDDPEARNLAENEEALQTALGSDAVIARVYIQVNFDLNQDTGIATRQAYGEPRVETDEEGNTTAIETIDLLSDSYYSVEIGYQTSGIGNQMPADPVRNGYRFIGWNTAKNGQGAWVTAETPLENTTTLYAQWEKVTMAEEFEPGYNNVTVTEGQAGQVTAPIFTKNGLLASPEIQFYTTDVPEFTVEDDGSIAISSEQTDGKGGTTITIPVTITYADDSVDQVTVYVSVVASPLTAETNPATQVVIEGNAIEPIIVETNKGDATVTITNLPNGLAFDSETNTISGTPTVDDWGDDETEDLTVTATVSRDSEEDVVVTSTITIQRHVVVDEGPEPGETVPSYDDLTKPGADITDVVVDEGPEPGETVPSYDDLTESGDDITDVKDETRTGKLVVYVRDINGRIHRADNALIADIGIHVFHKSEDEKVLEVKNEVDNWFTFTDNTDSQHGNDYRYKIEAPEGYRVASDDITLPPSLATYAKQLKAGVGELELVDGTQTYFIVLEHGKDEEGPKPGETVPSYDDLTEPGDDITDVIVEEGSEPGETVPSYDDETEPDDDITDVLVEEGPAPGETVPSYDDVTKPGDDITDVLVEEGPKPGKIVSSYDDETELGDDITDVIVEEGPEPGETVPSYDDETELGDDITDVIVEEGTEPGETVPGYDDLTEPGDDITDVVVEEGPEPGETVPSYDDLTEPGDDITDVVVEEGPEPGEIVPSYDDETELGDDITDAIVEEGSDPGETVPSYDDVTKPGDDITDVVVDEGSEPGETVPSYDDLTELRDELTDVVVEEGPEPGETVPSYDDLTELGDELADVVVEEGPEPGETTPSHDDLTKPRDEITDVVVNEGSEPGETVPGYDDLTELGDELTDVVVEEGSEPGETTPSHDDKTKLGDNVIDVKDETRTGKLVVYVRDINGRIHRADNTLIADIGIHVSHKSENAKALEVENEVDNWFSFTDNTDSQHGHDYGYKIETPEGYRVASEDITLTAPFATYAKQLKAGVGELQLADGKQTYFIVLDHGKDEEGPKPGETVPSYDDLTKPGDDITDVLVEEGSEPGETVPSYDDQTKLGDDITDVLVEEGPEPGETVPSYDDLTKLKDDITDVLVEEGSEPGETVPSYDDLTKLKDDITDVIVEEGSEPGETVPSYDDLTKLKDDITDVIVEEGSEPGETVPSYDDLTKLKDDITDVIVEEGPEPGETTPSYDDLTKLKDDITDVIVEEGSEPGETVPSYDDETELGDDITDVLVEEGSEPGETVPSYDDQTKLGDDITDVIVEEGSEPGETVPSYDDETELGDDITDVIVEEGPEPGETVLSYDDLTKLKDDITDVLVEEGSEPGETVPSYDDETELGDDITDVLVEEGPEPGETVPSYDDLTKLKDDITDVLFEEGPEPGETVPSYDDLTELGDDITDVIVDEGPEPGETTPSYDDLTKLKDDITDVIVEEGSEPGETVPSYDDLTKLKDDITDVIVEEGSEPGETVPSYDDLTKLKDDITDVIVEEGPAPGETTPSHDDKTKLGDDITDVIVEEGSKPGETTPSHDDKTKLADDVIDVVIDEESTSDDETAKPSEDSTKQSTDEKLPETGEVSSTAIFSAAALSILAGLGLVAPVSKKED